MAGVARVVAVWDTVGALGIPTYAGGKHVDTFEFADTRLSGKVRHGFRAVALDERRRDFTPTLAAATGSPITRVACRMAPCSGSSTACRRLAFCWSARPRRR
ncbi:DUF2235 domain-containing protein [Candidatus Accumulibacter sp. ACC003]|uniref:DUF2235 domain-containing protein n=1 Tax=Candidatus Accumulibacter sp. ACC003 TaxID=2823334 RepID=UPI00344FBDE8